MLNKEKFFEYVEEKLGQNYIVKYNEKELEISSGVFSIYMEVNSYKSKEDLLIKIYDNYYYYFSVINNVMNKLNRYYKKFKD